FPFVIPPTFESYPWCLKLSQSAGTSMEKSSKSKVLVLGLSSMQPNRSSGKKSTNKQRFFISNTVEEPRLYILHGLCFKQPFGNKARQISTPLNLRKSDTKSQYLILLIRTCLQIMVVPMSKTFNYNMFAYDF